MHHWASLDLLDKDLVIMGDMNLCYRKWGGQGDPQQGFINTVKLAQVSHALQQLVHDITRTQLVNELVHHSVIDHVYTNCQDRVSPPKVLPVGDSDHQGVVVEKIIHQATTHQQTIWTRSFKKTDLGQMLSDINQANINNLVTTCCDLESAANIFARQVQLHLDRHACTGPLNPGPQIQALHQPRNKGPDKE